MAREVRAKNAVKVIGQPEAAVSEELNERSSAERKTRESKTRKDPTRRDWLFAGGVALNVAAGLLLAVPLVGFVFSSFVERKDPRNWISLGSIENLPGESHPHCHLPESLHAALGWGDSRNPLLGAPRERQPVSGFCNQLHASWAVRCDGSRSPGCFCVLAMAALITKTEPRAAGPPPRGLFQYDYKVENGQLWVKGGEMPTLSNPV